jgi:hypothetical protein
MDKPERLELLQALRKLPVATDSQHPDIDESAASAMAREWKGFTDAQIDVLAEIMQVAGQRLFCVQ